MCHGYEKKFGSQIIETVSQALSPCIVEFKVTEAVSIGKIQAALYYAYTEVNDLELSWACHSTYDAANNTITADQIISIEFQKS